MWHIMELHVICGERYWKDAMPEYMAFESFDQANRVMCNTWYGGNNPQDDRFMIVMIPLV